MTRGSRNPLAEAQAARFPLEEAANVLRRRLPVEPEVFVVLGSGLGGLVDEVQDPHVIPFHSIPGFPGTGVAGHRGRLVAGEVKGRRVLMQAGRFHFYEGHPASVVVAPVRLAARLGAGSIIITNASGGIHRDLSPGDILLLDDHLNLMGRSPLAGPVEGGENRFPDMSAPYDPELQEIALAAALELKLHLSRGTYAAVLGPSYETPAEVRVCQRWGADAVGMSTVPEAITARALGLRVLGLSLISNRATGLGGGPLSHDEVLAAGRGAGKRMKLLVRTVIERLPADG